MCKKLFWAGDSTVKSNDYTTYPQTGIGQAMRLYLKKDIVVLNHAENGRSTKSFIDESRLAPIYNGMRKGDFLFIQFGHNDGKSQDPSRHTHAYGSYQRNLVKFINAARNRGAFPVLVTPVCRRWFSEDDTLQEGIHGDYPRAMIEIGALLDVPVIDLYASSRRVIEAKGRQGSQELFVTTDNTHLNYAGAFTFAGLIANELREMGSLYNELLLQAEEDKVS